MRKLLLLAASAAFMIGALLTSCAAQATGQAKPIAITATSGGYTLTLRVLPAESFAGPHAEMTRESGAKPDMLSASPPPNHHLVCFVKKNGKPVENARVNIRYRMRGGAWKSLPVVRMDVTGAGVATTHYGNNVYLAPGSYEAQVTVNNAPPRTFRFTLPAN